MGVEERCEPAGLALEGKGGEAAEYEAKDEDGEPEANGAKKLGVGHLR